MVEFLGYLNSGAFGSVKKLEVEDQRYDDDAVGIELCGPEL